MTPLPVEVDAAIRAIAADRRSGASVLLARALPALAAALDTGAAVQAARALCAAQPAMAPVWNAALHAVAAQRDRAIFDRFAAQAGRAPRALVRTALGALLPEPRSTGGPPLRVVTLSSSGSVRAVVLALHERHPVRLACTESRPALEGRQLAADFASAGVAVHFYGDAAAAHALAEADLVLVGADAIGAEAFVNKSGTRMLAAVAAAQGLPVYVAATRDKFVMPALWPRLATWEAPGEEIWEAPPAGVTVRNPCFERTPVDLVTAVLCDLGLIGADLVPGVCDGLQNDEMLRALDELIV